MHFGFSDNHGSSFHLHLKIAVRYPNRPEPQVYLLPDGAGATKPEFMFNYGVGAHSEWLHISVALVHPAKLPQQLGCGLYFRVLDLAGESPLNAACRNGVHLHVPQLQNIAKDLKLPEISKGQNQTAGGAPLQWSWWCEPGREGGNDSSHDRQIQNRDRNS